MNHPISRLVVVCLLFAVSLGLYLTLGNHKNTNSTPRRQLKRDHVPLMGGFQHVEHIVDEPMIQKAALFALQALQEAAPQSTPPPYAFGSQATKAKIMDAWQQVVEGLNIKLALLFVDEEDQCVGACTVIINNRFGALSVTKWNKVIPCKEATKLLHDSGGAS